MKAYIKYRDLLGIESIAWLRDMVDTITMPSLTALVGSVHTYINAGIVV